MNSTQRKDGRNYVGFPCTLNGQPANVCRAHDDGFAAITSLDTTLGSIDYSWATVARVMPQGAAFGENPMPTAKKPKPAHPCPPTTTANPSYPEPQFDAPQRVVSLDNLEAMCAHVSGVCHRYWVEYKGVKTVRVGYSNPDEYANEHPMFAVFPLYLIRAYGHETAHVVLDYANIIHDTPDGEGWQNFKVLRSCPPLWRNPNTGQWAPDSPSSPMENPQTGVEYCPECRVEHHDVCGMVQGCPCCANTRSSESGASL